MNDLEKIEFKKMQKEVAQIKIYLEALTSILGRCGQLPDILHKNMSGLIYRKNQPWKDDIFMVHECIKKAMESINYRFKVIDDELKSQKQNSAKSKDS